MRLISHRTVSSRCDIFVSAGYFSFIDVCIAFNQSKWIQYNAASINLEIKRANHDLIKPTITVTNSNIRFPCLILINRKKRKKLGNQTKNKLIIKKQIERGKKRKKRKKKKKNEIVVSVRLRRLRRDFCSG